ncbi:MAG: signal recognition particle protein [Spirochaetales bacterium]|nr:signal recognition particle protein [Spirochaetales bacterium]
MLERLSGKLISIIKQISGKALISDKNIESAIDEIKLALLEADVNLRVVRRFVNRTAEDAMGMKVARDVTPSQQFVKIVYDRLVEILGEKRSALDLKGPDTQSVILCMGLQGSGKTTTAAKLGAFLAREGRKPILVAADPVRPAAAEQLAVLGKQAGIDVFRLEEKSPAKIVKKALEKAGREQFDTVIVDTTGRMHVDDAMMKELEELKRLARPVESLLIADAMTGQQAVDIAKSFDERIGLTGVILSKFDSDARGGAALSIRSITGRPIKYVGTGEKIEDLEPFYPERMASRILGRGDIVSLVEKAEAAIEAEEAEQIREKMESNTFDFDDYLDQFRRVKKMGSVRSLIEMIPGLQGNVDEDKINLEDMKKEESIILSMTRKERKNPLIIGPGRRKRIARGSGTAVFDVNKLLKKFEKTKIMMKKMARNKDYQQRLIGNLDRH